MTGRKVSKGNKRPELYMKNLTTRTGDDIFELKENKSQYLAISWGRMLTYRSSNPPVTCTMRIHRKTLPRTRIVLKRHALINRRGIGQIKVFLVKFATQAIILRCIAIKTECQIGEGPVNNTVQAALSVSSKAGLRVEDGRRIHVIEHVELFVPIPFPNVSLNSIRTTKRCEGDQLTAVALGSYIPFSEGTYARGGKDDAMGEIGPISWVKTTFPSSPLAVREEGNVQLHV